VTLTKCSGGTTVLAACVQLQRHCGRCSAPATSDHAWHLSTPRIPFPAEGMSVGRTFAIWSATDIGFSAGGGVSTYCASTPILPQSTPP
jgi:hypothetical protein